MTTDYWSRSEYADIERDAAAEAAYFGMDEGDGPDPDDCYRDDPTACPQCGGPIEVDREDPSVGIFGDTVYCADEDCGWGEIRY